MDEATVKIEVVVDEVGAAVVVVGVVERPSCWNLYDSNIYNGDTQDLFSNEVSGVLATIVIELIHAWRRRTLATVGEDGSCRSERSVFLKEGKDIKRIKLIIKLFKYFYNRAVNGRLKD